MCDTVLIETLASRAAKFKARSIEFVRSGFSTQGGSTWEFSEGAHEPGGQHHECADLNVISDHPVWTGERADRGELLIIVRTDVRLPFGPSKPVTTNSVGFSGCQYVRRAAR
jgi:hypothetical protein